MFKDMEEFIFTRKIHMGFDTFKKVSLLVHTISESDSLKPYSIH